MRIVCQPATVLGFTQASIVIADVSRSNAVSATVTQLVAPVSVTAPPYLPVAVHDAFDKVPVWPLPDASAAVAPAPSLKPQAAMGPDWPRAVAAPPSRRLTNIRARTETLLM